MPTPADLYADALGDEARERQERLARERFMCCGMPKESGHHEHCPERPEDEPIGVADNQEGLF